MMSIWNSRYFWMSLVESDLQMRYRRSVLGVGWSLLHPLATTLVTCLVFHEIFHIDIARFAPLVLSGLACWAYITGVTLQGCQSYIQAESYIRQHPLPLAVYPLRTTLAAMTHFLIALSLVMVMTLFLQGTEHLTGVIYLLPGLMLLLIFGWATGIIMGFVNLVFRDMQHILEVGFQIAFYLTPIIYPVQVLLNSRIGWIAAYNPFYHMLNLIREPLLEGNCPPTLSIVIAGTLTLTLSVLAMFSLRYQQRRVVLYL